MVKRCGDVALLRFWLAASCICDDERDYEWVAVSYALSLILFLVRESTMAFADDEVLDRLLYI